MPRPPSSSWWREFFGNPASLELSSFPQDDETELEIRGLRKMLRLRPGDRIADICCGFGRHSSRLAALGHQVVGLDASDMMLGCARHLMAEGAAQLPLVRGDAARLPFGDGTFDVVLNLFNSFGYFLDEGSDLRVLQEAARVLPPGGRLLLDTRNRQFQILYAPYCQLVETHDGRSLVLRCQYDRAGKRLDSRWSLPDDPEAVVHEASIRLYGLDELRELVDAAGFDEVAVYGSYKGEAYEGWQRQLLFVARKRG
jgi:ubiquinone/menaquinone biosynthesis C-methylase UbiE